MANLDFPLNPILGQEYKGPKGKSYWWDGVKWAVKRPVVSEPVPEPVPEVITPPAPDPAPVEISLMSVSIGGIDFPPFPAVGEKFLASSGITYEWDGGKWILNQSVIIDNNGPSNGNYTLPTATNTRLGGVRIGSGIINYDGTISVDLTSIKGPKGDTGAQGSPGPKGDTGDKGDKGDPGNATTPATRQFAGVVKAGSNIDVTQDGTISVPTATNSTLGVVKAGNNVSIDNTGAINITKGAGINTVSDIPDVNSTAGGAALNDGALLVYNASSNRWDVINNLRSDSMDGGFF
jgi:hypothetical protein